MSLSEKDSKHFVDALPSTENTTGLAVSEEPEPSALQPKLGRGSVLAIAYLCVTTWIAYSASSATALVSGGLNVFFWGLLICVVGNLAGAASLAEVASLHPLGNHATWAFRLAPVSHRRALAYMTNWLYLIGYLLLGVAAAVFLSQILLAMVQTANADTYTIAPTHVSATMNAWTIAASLFGILASSILAHANTFSLIWHLCGFVIFALFILIQSRHNYNSAEQAFVTIVNESGWSSSFVPWVTSLSQAAISTTAWDAVSHFAPEMYHPQRDVPFGMMAAIGLNGFVGLIYAVIFVFCLPPDATDLLATPKGFPFAEFLSKLANGSVAGTVLLLLVILIPFILTIIDIQMCAARIAYSFARQGGLPRIFTHVNKRFDAPLPCMLLVLVVDIGLAWIYIGSSAAFFAFASAPTVVLGWTYAIGAAYMLFHGRPVLHVKTPFSLGPILGPICNAISVVFNLAITVFLCLPASLPVAANTMNYTSVIITASVVCPVICWFAYARRSYAGPLVEQDELSSSSSS